jgi:hypothetical protein
MSDSKITDELDPLTRLALKHGTDKWGLHFYTRLYHRLFSGLRDKPIRLLEIGIGGYVLETSGGASLAMWADYFPSGQITGIDIVAKRLALDSRIKLFQGSQDDPHFLKMVCNERGPFDIIIDDGSHVPRHVAASFILLFPHLVDGGTYVMEDIQTTFWPEFGGSPLHGGDTIKLMRTIIDSLNHAELAIVGGSQFSLPFAKQIRAFSAFHNVFVVEKGDNCEPSNYAYDLGNPHAIDAVRSIEREMADAPSADGMANLIELYLKAKNLVRAQQAADRALSLWPASTSALMAAYHAASARRDTPAKVDYLERMLQAEPGNAVLHRLLNSARAELNN